MLPLLSTDSQGETAELLVSSWGVCFVFRLLEAKIRDPGSSKEEKYPLQIDWQHVGSWKAPEYAVGAGQVGVKWHQGHL